MAGLRNGARGVLCVLALLVLTWPVLTCIAGTAQAHTRSESHSSWQVSGQTVLLTFTVPVIEARRLTPGRPPPDDAALVAYLAPRVGATAAGRRCPMIGAGQAVAAVEGVRRVEFRFDCPDTRRLQVHVSAFFELVPSHTNFAQVQTDSGDFIEDLITTDRRTIDVTGPTGASLAGGGAGLRDASFWRYIALGILHIFTGVDHQAFLVGLILLSRNLRDIAFVVTGFTLGHSLTLALAVTGVLRPHAEYIDALIGLTIALVGAENLAVHARRPTLVIAAVVALLGGLAAAGAAGFGGLPVLILAGAGLFSAGYLTVSSRVRDAARLRLVVTLVFGLVHGFGFAADLLEMRLPTDRLVELLVGFNLGVELGQLAIVGSVLLVAGLLVRVHLAPPRAVVNGVATAALIGVGLYWFVARSYA